MNKRGKILISRLFQSKLVLGVLIIIAGVSVFRFSGEVMRRNRINGEIQQLKGEINRLNSEQEALNELIGYLGTDAYIEEQARKKLNLKRPGETLVVVGTPKTTDAEGTTAAGNTVVLWWDHFFSNE